MLLIYKVDCVSFIHLFCKCVIYQAVPNLLIHQAESILFLNHD